MARLIVQVEGPTEEEFVNGLLAPHLENCGWESVTAIRMGRARSRDDRHGVKGWDVVLSSVVKHLKEDAGCYVSTMADYYRLPASGVKAWPSRAEANRRPAHQRGAVVQQAMADSVAEEHGPGHDPRRFIPFVTMHEFEALLFSDCEAFARGLYQPDLAAAFQEIRSLFTSPEEINDTPQNAPSKRVEAVVPRYKKPLFGNLAALQIGLPAMRRECPHFAAWITRLEQIVKDG